MSMTQEVIVQKNIPATMRDGVVLMADVYRPAGEGKYPVLLSRTPYAKDILAVLDPMKACKHGYMVVVQDVRGRFQSEGEFIPFENEFDDGFDSVEWAARLPGSDGNVAMWSGSYVGITQWSAALKQPPSLRTIIPAITGGNYLNGMIRRGGARELALVISWIQKNLAFDSISRKLRNKPKELMDSVQLLVRNADELPKILDILPLKNMPNVLGTADYMFDLLRRPINDPYWSVLNPKHLYEQLKLPVMHIGGWYDILAGETLRQYQIMRRQAERFALVKPMLIMGPWFHDRYFSNIVGELDFGLASMGGFLNYTGDLTDLHIRWYDAIIKEKTDWLQSQSPVQVFVMGENRWRGCEDWPIKEAQEEKWYFHSNGEANTLFGDGTLNRESPSYEPNDGFIYDPNNPVKTNGGAVFHNFTNPPIPPGPRDQRAREHRSDILCYTSSTLETDYTVIGPCHVVLYAASSAPDTDFVASLIDVYPDGRALNVTDGIIRASARESYPHPGEFKPVPPSLIEPDRVYRYEIDLWATAITFKAGHQIRVEITSSNFPRWDRNLNTGQDGFDSYETKVAKQTIVHNPDCPSCIVLPHISRS